MERCAIRGDESPARVRQRVRLVVAVVKKGLSRIMRVGITAGEHDTSCEGRICFMYCFHCRTIAALIAAVVHPSPRHGAAVWRLERRDDDDCQENVTALCGKVLLLRL